LHLFEIFLLKYLRAHFSFKGCDCSLKFLRGDDGAITVLWCPPLHVVCVLLSDKNLWEVLVEHFALTGVGMYPQFFEVRKVARTDLVVKEVLFALSRKQPLAIGEALIRLEVRIDRVEKNIGVTSVDFSYVLPSVLIVHKQSFLVPFFQNRHKFFAVDTGGSESSIIEKMFHRLSSLKSHE